MFIAVVMVIAVISILLSVRSFLSMKKNPEVNAVKRKLFKDRIIYRSSSSEE